ncbi:MAG: tetratricopeptide (TPR) repeat protein [Cellvibrionaceae bacterium]|jgi:tetratricopeptide (TPR) repeat protein
MNSEITATIQAICVKGYQHYSKGDYDSALRLFYQAWVKLPKPQTQEPDAETVLSAIGDTYYRMKKYELAIEALRSALACEQTETRSLVEMRLGQTLLNTGHDLQAINYLQRAYCLGGDAVFTNEKPKYKEAISGL